MQVAFMFLLVPLASTTREHTPGSIHIYDVRCGGTENAILSCPLSNSGSCTSGLAAAMECQGKYMLRSMTSS